MVAEFETVDANTDSRAQAVCDVVFLDLAERQLGGRDGDRLHFVFS